MFKTEFSKELTKKMEKLKKKNKILAEAVFKKMREIEADPKHHKPLRYELKGYRRVHVMRSFVLTFRIDNANKRLIFEDFDHHDNVYGR
jgi:mRNA interferase RelE/StbE/toxin YoeB